MTAGHKSKRAPGLARFLHRAGGLKSLPRTGWLDRGVDPTRCESVADHSLRVALLAWLAAEELESETDLDVDRLLRLALIHDLAETLVGDIPPYDPSALADVPERDRAAFLDRRHHRAPHRASAKKAAERAAMADLLADLSPTLRDRLGVLWRELELGESAEARFVKQADMLETYLQSREYAAKNPAIPVGSFAAEVAEAIADPGLAALRDAIATLEPESSPADRATRLRAADPPPVRPEDRR